MILVYCLVALALVAVLGTGSPTKRFVNWPACTMASTTITGVTGVQIDPGGQLLKFSGDGDRYHTTIVPDVNEPKATINAADLAALRSLPNGTRGTFSATHADAKNGVTTGGGALIYSSTTAIVENNTTQGDHRQFGGGSLSLAFECSDGTTNPLGSAAA